MIIGEYKLSSAENRFLLNKKFGEIKRIIILLKASTKLFGKGNVGEVAKVYVIGEIFIR